MGTVNLTAGQGAAASMPEPTGALVTTELPALRAEL